MKNRVWEHKNKKYSGFTEKYKVDKIVYFEIFDDIESAINREKQIKNWKREWKVALIERDNIGWADLYSELEIE